MPAKPNLRSKTRANKNPLRKDNNLDAVTEPRRLETDSDMNWALDKPTIQSSTYKVGTSDKAVDGDTTGQWSHKSVTHTNSEENPYWRVDLETTINITKVVVYNRAESWQRLKGFHLILLNENQTVVSTLKDQKVTSNNKEVISIQVNGEAAHYVKIQLPDTGILSLAEVQVFGNEIDTNDDDDEEEEEEEESSKWIMPSTVAIIVIVVGFSLIFLCGALLWFCTRSSRAVDNSHRHDADATGAVPGGGVPKDHHHHYPPQQFHPGLPVVPPHHQPNLHPGHPPHHQANLHPRVPHHQANLHPHGMYGR